MATKASPYLNRLGYSHSFFLFCFSASQVLKILTASLATLTHSTSPAPGSKVLVHRFA